MRYGFIGLGNLGGHLAASLLRGGFDVSVHDADIRAGERHLAAGARWAATPAEAAQGVDALVTCLPSPAVSEAVLAQVLPDLRGRDWIEMSTLGRTEILRLAEIAEALGSSDLCARMAADQAPLHRLWTVFAQDCVQRVYFCEGNAVPLAKHHDCREEQTPLMQRSDSAESNVLK